MNKYQEALDNAIDSGIITKDWKLLKELVDKATPKKPYYWGDWYGDEYWKCPCCEKTYDVDYGKNNYCHNCGQAIDWSE